MSDQLGAALVLCAVAAGSTAAGYPWLAVAAIVAAVPFLAAGLTLALGHLRAGREGPPSPR